jgi:hypothetical protein
MTMESLQAESVFFGFLLFFVLMMLVGLLMLYAGRPFLRRLADWLLNRRGFEKLGRPLRVRPGNTPYENWLRTTKVDIPVHECQYIDDVRTIDLEPWTQQGDGIRGLYLRLADYQFTDGRILEIPPGGATTPTRHLFEIGIHFLGGPGHTVLSRANKPPRRIDWQKGSVYSVPINTRYQHFNDSEKPVRLLAISSFPFMINSTNSKAFIFNNSSEFPERVSGEILSRNQSVQKQSRRNYLDFIPDALTADLVDHDIRGKDTKNRYWTLSGNSMVDINVSEMAGKTLKRAHRSTSEATVLMLSGEGYLITWPEGAWHRRIRVNWHEGTLMTQPIFWYRQFMNPGNFAARNLTFGARSLVENLGLRFLDQMETDLPEISKDWADELKAGARKEIDKPSGH